MGHNRNYSNFSKHFNKQENKNVETEAVETVETVETEAVETVETEAVETEAVEVLEFIGVVTGCKKLYVRKEANKESESLCVIDKNTEVIIDTENSTEDFYKVCTSAGVEGYCMKKFISIK